MAAFSGRPLFYQMSILLLLLATLLFCVGLALPWWTQTYSKIRRSVTGHSGLWLTCSLSGRSGDAAATSTTTAPRDLCKPIEAPGWFRVVQGMQGAGLVQMLAACVYAIFVNFCRERAVSSKIVEILAGTGGVLGTVSATIYVTKISTILKHNHGIRYSWAFSVDFAASILVIFIATFIALTNRRSPTPADDEAVKVIVEDCGGQEIKDRRSRSPAKQPGGGRRAMEVERSPVRTRRLEAISETFVSLEEEEEEEKEGKVEVNSTRRSLSYVNSAGEVAHSDCRTDAL